MVDRANIRRATTPVPGLEYGGMPIGVYATSSSTAGRIAAQRQARSQSRKIQISQPVTSGKAGQRTVESQAYGGWFNAAQPTVPRSKSFGYLANTSKDFSHPFTAESTFRTATEVTVAVKGMASARPAPTPNSASLFGASFSTKPVSNLDVYGRDLGSNKHVFNR